MSPEGQRNLSMILDDDIDILLLTETWSYTRVDEVYISKRNPQGYVLRSFPRMGSKRGGIAFILQDVFRDVMLGDFNFHYDGCSDSHVDRINTLLNDPNLTQLGNVSTHRSGHILALAVVHSHASCLALESVQDMPGLSDHRSLLCQMTFSRPSKAKQIVTSKNTRVMSLSVFQADVKCFADSVSQCSEENLVDAYSAGLREVLDCHAPSGHPLP